MRNTFSNHSEVIFWDQTAAFGFPLMIVSSDNWKAGFVSSVKNECFSCWIVSIFQCVGILLSLSAIGSVSDNIVSLSLFDSFPVVFDRIFNGFSC